MKLQSASVDDTLAIGRSLVGQLPSGCMVCLLGQLGGGKTHFVKGLVEGSGGQAFQVTSPTFTLLQPYHTPKRRIYHIDLYRLADGNEVPDEVHEALEDESAIICVEWADLFPELWRGPLMEIEFEHGKGDERFLYIRSEGFDADRIEALVAPYLIS